MNFIDSLQPGAEVYEISGGGRYVPDRYTKATVARRTPSGQIVLDNGHRYSARGSLVGGRSYRDALADPSDPKVRQMAAHAREQHEHQAAYYRAAVAFVQAEKDRQHLTSGEWLIIATTLESAVAKIQDRRAAQKAGP